MNGSPGNPPNSRRLWAVLVVALVWPPVYFVFAHWVAPSLHSPQAVSNAEIQQLLNVRRYTLHVPPERDGWFLSLEGVVDGETKQSGGASVAGGSNIVLLVRQINHTDKIEYCWYDGVRTARGVIDDPLVGAAVSAQRQQGEVAEGDWLLRGGHKSVSSEAKSADFELRVALHPPDVNGETERPHATKPAVGPVSNKDTSPPTR